MPSLKKIVSNISRLRGGRTLILRSKFEKKFQNKNDRKLGMNTPLTYSNFKKGKA